MTQFGSKDKGSVFRTIHAGRDPRTADNIKVHEAEQIAHDDAVAADDANHRDREYGENGTDGPHYDVGL